MSKYVGFQIKCGCACSHCKGPLILEGYSDAAGTHYCERCKDYVTPTRGRKCPEQSWEKVKARLKVIVKSGALGD